MSGDLEVPNRRMEFCRNYDCGKATGRLLRDGDQQGYCDGCNAVIERFGHIHPEWEHHDDEYVYYSCANCGNQDPDQFRAYAVDGTDVTDYIGQDDVSTHGLLYVERNDYITTRTPAERREMRDRWVPYVEIYYEHGDIDHVECTACGDWVPRDHWTS